jgi:hypothetical protein
MRLRIVADSSRPIVRLTTAVLNGFCFFTIAEIVWGLLTPGDYFANGNPLLVPTVIGFVIVGIYLGVRATGRGIIWIFAITVACFCYWAFVPFGWWVKSLR